MSGAEFPHTDASLTLTGFVAGRKIDFSYCSDEYVQIVGATARGTSRRDLSLADEASEIDIH